MVVFSHMASLLLAHLVADFSVSSFPQAIIALSKICGRYFGDFIISLTVNSGYVNPDAVIAFLMMVLHMLRLFVQ